MTVAAFVLGLFAGVCAGVGIMALMFVARESEAEAQAPVFPRTSALDTVEGRASLRKQTFYGPNKYKRRP